MALLAMSDFYAMDCWEIMQIGGNWVFRISSKLFAYRYNAIKAAWCANCFAV